LCYSSDSTGEEEFVVGQDNVERVCMRNSIHACGDKQLLICLHISIWLVGDVKKYTRASILYELELVFKVK